MDGTPKQNNKHHSLCPKKFSSGLRRPFERLHHTNLGTTHINLYMHSQGSRQKFAGKRGEGKGKRGEGKGKRGEGGGGGGTGKAGGGKQGKGGRKGKGGEREREWRRRGEEDTSKKKRRKVRGKKGEEL